MRTESKAITRRAALSHSERSRRWIAHASDRELSEIGFIRARDGALLDNRDDFYVEHRDDFLRSYDCRTHTAILRSLLDKLIDAFLGESVRSEGKEAA